MYDFVERLSRSAESIFTLFARRDSSTNFSTFYNNSKSFVRQRREEFIGGRGGAKSRVLKKFGKCFPARHYSDSFYFLRVVSNTHAALKRTETDVEGPKSRQYILKKERMKIAKKAPFGGSINF